MLLQQISTCVRNTATCLESRLERWRNGARQHVDSLHHRLQDARCFVSQLCEEWRVLLQAQEAETQADLETRQARSSPE